MMRSMFSAVSGLKAHQEMMDVIGNNIANINTSGFKKSRVTFQELLSQTLQGASLPTANRGGTNPMQIGPGVGVASIDTIFDGNSLQDTGKSTDLGISGDGLFILADGSRDYYTRAGNFYFDSQGNFASLMNGMLVQGWMPDATGAITTTAAPSNITIDMSGSAPAKATSNMIFSGNFDSQLNNGVLAFPNGTGVQLFTVSDGLATPTTTNLQLSLTPAGPFNTWNWTVTDTSDGAALGTGTMTVDSATHQVTAITGSDVTIGAVTLAIPTVGDDPNHFTVTAPATGSITIPAGGIPALTFTPPQRNVPQPVYDSLGNEYNAVINFVKNTVGNWTWSVSSITDSLGKTYAPSGGGALQFDTDGNVSNGATGTMSFTPSGSATAMAINLDFSKLNQYAADTTAGVQTQDGYTSGGLQSYSIDKTGTIVGVFSNGVNKTLAQVALARFPNPAGLSREGDTLFSETSNSGIKSIQAAGTSGFGTIKPGSLEMSNVDLAQEFSNMIISQRGFEANSKIITTSDEMLQTLVNLKR